MSRPTLTLDEVGTDPFATFATWLKAASETEPNDPNAMALATVDGAGMPDVRMVLLKGLDAAGFVFYTNFESTKGRELLAQPRAGLCFHWKSQRRQVRVRGPVEIVSQAEADAYYASRPRGSRIGAWASDQSRPLKDRSVLEARIAEMEDRFGPDGDIARPERWSGFRVRPLEIEFWQDGAYRLHDRFRFTRGNIDTAAWEIARLYP
ncbi:pyridoxamine 5'-phosphate oxidase [Aureimonas altamirensis]|uniref:Pyridoxine/pyridoxamine 5'-phosphate oxidase n=1 Tax=Aureimonas altamirensis TaxID=370622 RepID=A0A0B1Q6K8_9HYPH|nr:pyridoxamine 5'-phosphate oxidase [Aureimonas altamirensis]KHJ56019.1 pyridoxamine 5'-phosphate oxidase [Aureimonas altamirensis]